MPAHDQRARPYARFVYPFAAAGVLLCLCSGCGREHKPTAPAGQPALSPSSVNPDRPGPAKHKRIPRTPK